jgi:hypothetical protein
VDATLRTLARFNDPNLWDVVPNVPIFGSHRVVKRGSDGRLVKMEITPTDLQRIVHMFKQGQTPKGVYPRITAGHMHLSKETPEHLQPPPLGWGRNLRVGRWGKPDKYGQQQLGVLADLWFYKGSKPKTGDYPYRSVEYYPDTHEITGIALLRRDPELDLGIVSYERSGRCFWYWRDNDMVNYDADRSEEDRSEDEEPIGLEPTGQPSAAAPDPEFQEHFMRCVRHPDFQEHLMRFVRHNFPHLPAMHDEHTKKHFAAVTPALPSATNLGIPGTLHGEARTLPGGAEEKKDAMSFFRQSDPRQLDQWARSNPRLYEQLAQIVQFAQTQQSEIQSLRNAQRLAEYKAKLLELREQGYPIDMDEEVKHLVDAEGNTIAPEQFERDCQLIVRYGSDRRGPADFGRGLPSLASFGLESRGGAGPRELTQAEWDKAYQYMREKGCTEVEAEKWVRTAG